jgi:hypothetical protein
MAARSRQTLKHRIALKPFYIVLKRHDIAVQHFHLTPALAWGIKAFIGVALAVLSGGVP